ncbi:MAG TPA: extracellular solute-binding protein [Streptosporangiaceae bacterium]|nr:extracellular solute-binding protein [Streptosporangiaceae bacterium]
MSPSTRSKLRITRPRWPLAAAMVAAAMVAAACGSASGSGKSGGSGTAGGTSVTAWIVTTGPSPANTKINQAVSDFEAHHHDDHITVDYIENQSYKQKIQLAMGAGNPPTIFWTWGGGPLKQYIDAGDVQSLGQPSYASSFLPSSLGAVTFDGKLYGVPIEGTQPVYFFYNKNVFREAGLTSFPSTWSALLADVHTLKAKGKTPISLAEGDQWPGLMYLEYLTDRIGGPSAFDAIEQGKADAWSNPAVIQALSDIQALARAGAFQSGYDSLKFSGGGSDALVYSGKAAMQLMGDWDISSVLGLNKSFVTSGNLGLATFPAVAGGKGNPADLAGNTASYVAIASHATAKQKAVAEAFFTDELATTGYAKASVGAGEVPVTKGAAPLFAGQQLASFDQRIYSSVQKAPSFQYSWDQSLSPAEATSMLTNLAQVFELSQTPQKFASVMNHQLGSGSS